MSKASSYSILLLFSLLSKFQWHDYLNELYSNKDKNNKFPHRFSKNLIESSCIKNRQKLTNIISNAPTIFLLFSSIRIQSTVELIEWKYIKALTFNEFLMAHRPLQGKLQSTMLQSVLKIKFPNWQKSRFQRNFPEFTRVNHSLNSFSQGIKRIVLDWTLMLIKSLEK